MTCQELVASEEPGESSIGSKAAGDTCRALSCQRLLILLTGAASSRSEAGDVSRAGAAASEPAPATGS